MSRAMLPARIVLAALLLAAASPAWAQATSDQRERARAVAKACRADAQKFCKGVEPGGGRLLACLQGHETEISASCRTTLKGGKQ